MAILIGEYTPKKKMEMMKELEIWTMYTHNGTAWIKAIYGYQCIVSRGKSLEESCWDDIEEGTSWVYSDDEIVELMHDLAENAAYVKDNPSAKDRNERIALVEAMSRAVYQYYAADGEAEDSIS